MDGPAPVADVRYDPLFQHLFSTSRFSGRFGDDDLWHERVLVVHGRDWQAVVGTQDG